MRETIHIARTKDKTSAQLKGIFPQFVLRVPAGLGAGTRTGIVLAKNVEQVRVLQLQRFIGLAFFIYQERKADARLFAECSGISAVAQSHRRQCRSALAKRLFVGAQLRGVLAAENSTVVPQENNHRRLPQPQRTQPHFAAFAIRQVNHRQAAVECRFHAHHCVSRARRVKVPPAYRRRFVPRRPSAYPQVAVAPLCPNLSSTFLSA